MVMDVRLRLAFMLGILLHPPTHLSFRMSQKRHAFHSESPWQGSVLAALVGVKTEVVSSIFGFPEEPFPFQFNLFFLVHFLDVQLLSPLLSLECAHF